MIHSRHQIHQNARYAILAIQPDGHAKALHLGGRSRDTFGPARIATKGAGADQSSQRQPGRVRAKVSAAN